MNASCLEHSLGVLIDPLAEQAFERGRPYEHTYAHLGPLFHTSGLTVAYFSPNGIDMRKRRVTGWRYHPRGGWRRAAMPLPRAVYNRLARRSLEQRSAMRRLLDEIRKSRLLFNPGFLAKDEALLALGKHSVPTPRFAVVRDVSDALEAVRCWGVAYLKPIDGSLGRGIVRVERARGARKEKFHITANPAEPAPPHKLQGDSSVFVRFVRDLAKYTTYIVQEGVDLPLVDGGPVDLRSLVQRVRSGWALSGVAGRAAPAGHVSTHTVRGGRSVPFSTVAGLCGIGRADVEELMQSAAKALEAELGDGFFEFSADIAVTCGGKLSILEMNARPFPFDEEEVRALAARRLLEFALQPIGNRRRSRTIG